MNAMRRLAHVFPVTCSVGLCLVMLGCSRHAGDSEWQARAAAPDDKAEAKAAFAITALQLAEEFEKDSKAARQKYQGKVIDLSGRIDRLNRNIGGGDAFVVLDGGKEGVRCVTVDKQPWNKVVPGQKVKLRGTLADNSTPMLLQCEILETGESPALVVTAEQLAKEAAADAEGTDKKYKGKPLIVTGEIVELKPAKGEEYLKLKGDDQRKVYCVFPLQGDMIAGLKEGQRVKILGQYSGTHNKTVDLILCFVMRDK